MAPSRLSSSAGRGTRSAIEATRPWRSRHARRNQSGHAGQVKSPSRTPTRRPTCASSRNSPASFGTRDRLLVRILRYANNGLRPYFDGVGAKGPAWTTSRTCSRIGPGRVPKALETTEIIGVSKSFDRFIRTIYEQSDNAEESLWTTGADGKYERLTSLTIEAFWQRDSTKMTGGPGRRYARSRRQFLFRFRARRALYECLSLTYPELVRGGGTMRRAQTTTAVPGQRGSLRASGRP